MWTCSPSEATLELAVRDDGSGFDAAAGEDNTGLGRSLIDAFVRQLRGELEITGDAGTSLVALPPWQNMEARALRPQPPRRLRLPSATNRRPPRPPCRTWSLADEPMTDADWQTGFISSSIDS